MLRNAPVFNLIPAVDMTLKLGSVHPLAWILKVPELRARALCGPSIEAAFIARAMDRITNARSLSRDIGVSYAAAHAAVERLVGFGRNAASRQTPRKWRP